MRKAFQRGSMQVLAHPDDLAMLREAGPELARELGGVQHLDFVEERRIDRGSVMVRTPAGEIDGTMPGKAEKIEQSCARASSSVAPSAAPPDVARARRSRSTGGAPGAQDSEAVPTRY